MNEPGRATMLVGQNNPTDHIERSQGRMEGDGLEVTIVRATSKYIPSNLDSDGLIVLGGPMSCCDDAAQSWLGDGRVLVRGALECEGSRLGVCLRAQLLAQAAGGTVARGDSGAEAGLIGVHARDDAVAADAVFGTLHRSFREARLHGDTIGELPAEALWSPRRRRTATKLFGPVEARGRAVPSCDLAVHLRRLGVRVRLAPPPGGGQAGGGRHTGFPRRRRCRGRLKPSASPEIRRPGALARVLRRYPLI